MTDIQKAAYSKRLFAFLADAILVAIITSGLFFVFSAVSGIDSHSAKYTEIIKSYEERYGVTFGLSNEEYEKLTPEAKSNYKTAVDAANSDAEANKAVKTYYTLLLSGIAAGILLSVLIVEFAVPVILKDGRTPGKRLFGLGVMRNGCIRISAPVLFIRAVIGKGLFEIVLPVFILFTVLTNITGFFGIILLIVFAVFETVSLVKSGGSSFLHDVLTDTVVIDWSSQRIFASVAERDEYLKKLEEDKAEHGLYY